MQQLIVRHLTKQYAYTPVWQAMQHFIQQRQADSIDEVWLLQHKPVFTQGLAGKDEHILNPHGIPIVRSDRGGQVTYHGPGQLMVYTLLDLKRLGLYPRRLVQSLQQCVIDYLASLQIDAVEQADAPGVYVQKAKICSIGLRIRKGCSYHGIALNVAMDLTPFSYINPCGHRQLAMTQISQFHENITLNQVAEGLISNFKDNFGYNRLQLSNDCPGELLNDAKIASL